MEEEGSCTLFHRCETKVGDFFLFTHPADKRVHIHGIVWGLLPNTAHGCHIHKWGDMWTTKCCEGCGDHFSNPYQVHGAPGEPRAHWGDLGNVVADNQGVARLPDTALAPEVQLSDLFGRSIVVHDGEDDLGRYADINPESAKTGNSGARWACGPIVRKPASLL